jgi:gamma-glutamylcyclotransferase (GGCT)/AIG2-like uncharacterized protein YtfP
MTGDSLYVYGTLLVPDVFRSIVGRSLASRAAVLDDFGCSMLRGKVYPAIVDRPGARVQGAVYTGLDERDLALLDEYEGEFYERRSLLVSVAGSALAAYAYVLRPAHHGELADEPWDLERFRREHLARYLSHLALIRRAPSGVP